MAVDTVPDDVSHYHAQQRGENNAQWAGTALYRIMIATMRPPSRMTSASMAYRRFFALAFSPRLLHQ